MKGSNSVFRIFTKQEKLRRKTQKTINEYITETRKEQDRLTEQLNTLRKFASQGLIDEETTAQLEKLLAIFNKKKSSERRKKYGLAYDPV